MSKMTGSFVDVHMHGEADIWLSGHNDYTALHIKDDYTQEVFRITFSGMDRHKALSCLLSALKAVDVPDMTMDGQQKSWRNPMSGLRFGVVVDADHEFVPTVALSGQTSWIELNPGVTMFTSSLTKVRIHLGDM